MSHKSRRRGVAAGLGLSVGSALTAGFISEAAAPIALADGTLPAAPPAPEQLPEAPPAPLSYLWDLVEQVGRHAAACSLRAARRPRRRSLAPAGAALPVDRKVDRTGYRHDCRDNDCGPAPADNPCCV
jgi:hypothetical protein